VAGDLRFGRMLAPSPGWLAVMAVKPGDEVQKQVAEVAKTFDRRTDEPAVLLARAITAIRGRRR
jgi:hypothetical protein